jgi:hypothetical protein
MNKFYLLIYFTFLVFTASQAQVIAYHENFNNTVHGVTLTNFVLNSAAPYSDTLYTAGAYAQTNTTASGQQVLVINNNISTYNLHNVTVSWKEYRTQYYRAKKGTIESSPSPNATYFPNTNPISLEYSLDGVHYTAVTDFTQNTTNYWSWRAINNGVPIKLPFEVSNKANVRLRWKISVANANTDYYAMDDVMLKGEPITGFSTFRWSSRPLNESPFEVSSASSREPYKVDGVTLRWTRTNLGSGTVVESSNVNTTFQSKKTLNLIQTGASTTSGTQVILQLGEKVSGLSFTIYDVDRTGGQFKDKVQIIGYDGATAIPLTKNSMLPTIYNEFKGDAFVGGQDNAVDAKVNSNKGNVTISFVKNIDRVVIKYFNDDAAKGRQGIAISDISWAMVDVAIAPMPVELVSFKAQALNGNAKLTWVTATEKNNDKFVIERSEDGKVYTKIGEVNGHGNSSTSINYTFIDRNPAVAVNYYRLRQLDLDGTATFSNIVALDFHNKFVSLAPKAVLYPTVAYDVLNLSLSNYNGNVSISVHDMAGKQLIKFASISDKEITLPVQSLKSGAYVLSVNNSEYQETLRFIKE